MPSPFPGMDPYIEASGMWGDFHGTLLAAIRADLNSRLPIGFAASIELYIWADDEEPDQPKPARIPDVLVRENRRRKRGESSVATMAAPSTIVLPRLAPRKRRYVKIVDVRAKTIVTVLELLSPANKKGGADRTHYLEKRNEYLASGLSFVEIDLLRGGRRLPLGKTRSKTGDYYAMVCRAWEFPRAGFWTFGLRDPLPDIPVPLTEELGDTRLRLRSCVDRAYEEGRYSTSLSYDEPLEPRPPEQDRDWIDQLLTKQPR